MVSTLIDSNVLLDVLTEDEAWLGWASSALALAADRGRLVINPVIFAEVSTRFSRIEDLEQALSVASFDREEIPYEGAFLAAKAFLSYRRRGGERRSTLPDFFIGAHAAVAGYHLLTRDAARYRTSFPGLRLWSPED